MAEINNIDDLRLQPQTPASRVQPQNELDRDAFLRIFLAQLESQDPLAPQDSAQLSAQLAQFSQLEASVNANTALTNISEKLDSLIDVTRGGGTIDPVSLIGKRIEFPESALSVPRSGDSPELRTDLSTERGGLLIQVTDPATGEVGAFTTTAERASDGSLGVLPRGSYRLRFAGSAPVLATPLGTSPLQFVRLRNVNGEVVEQRDANGAPSLFSFAPGRSYRFTVQAVDPTGRLSPVDLPTNRSDVADAVTFVDGQARIRAGGSQVDPAQIRQILNAAP